MILASSKLFSLIVAFFFRNIQYVRWQQFSRHRRSKGRFENRVESVLLHVQTEPKKATGTEIPTEQPAHAVVAEKRQLEKAPPTVPAGEYSFLSFFECILKS